MSDDDDNSVVSLEESLRAMNVLSGFTPVRKKHDRLEKRLTKIEKKLNDYRITQENNADLEREWIDCRSEIFGDGGLPPAQRRKERKTQERQDFLQRMASPKRQREKLVTDGITKSYHDEIHCQAKEKPGIGEYHTTVSALDTRGGNFNVSNSKSEIEWMIHRAASAPGSHVILPSTLDLKGGRFNQSAKPLTERDWIEKRAKLIPGPGQYETSKNILNLSSTGGGKFNDAKHKNHPHIREQSILYLPSTLQTYGGRFNQSAKPLTERDWIEKRAKLIPGPGHYKSHHHQSIAGTKKQGGKFFNSNSKNDIEWKIYESRNIPGPGGYNVGEAMNASSRHVSAGGAGRFTMVYRPLEESQQHLAKGGIAEKSSLERRRSIHQHPREKKRLSGSSTTCSKGSKGEYSNDTISSSSSSS